MHQASDPESNDTRLQMALKCVHTTLRRKILGSPNDVVGVLLYGSEKKFGINDFEHLSLILPLDSPEAKSIQNIENYTGPIFFQSYQIRAYFIKDFIAISNQFAS